jgi:transcription-repair coupling factor (superfamily II helicase)
MFLHALAEGPDRHVGGLQRGAVSYALALRLRASEAPAWITVPGPADADRLVAALRFYLPGRAVHLFPSDDGRPWDGAPRDPAASRSRILARAALADAGAGKLGGLVIVAPAAARSLRLPALSRLDLHPGLHLPPKELVRWLVAHGYFLAPHVDAEGLAAARGGTVECWGIGNPAPTRVAWFDDEVEIVRGPHRLLPAREASLDAESAERAAAYLHAVASERGVVANARRQVLDDFRDATWFAGADDYLPALAECAPVEPPARRFVVEPSRSADALREFLDDVEARWNRLDAEERPLVRVEDRYASVVDLGGAAFTAAGTDMISSPAGLRVEGAELAPVAAEIRRRLVEGAVLLVVEPGAREGRVRQLFASHGLRFGACDDRLGAPPPGALILASGQLPEGFSSPGLTVVTADEIFGTRLQAPTPPATTFRKAALQGVSSLRRGDLVVHARHGIGRFVGLVRRPLGDVEGDFVQVEYRDAERLYVPVGRLDLVAPYRSAVEGAAPRLDKLGGSTWDVRRAKVKDAVLKLAAELLRIHARRKLAEARAYPGRDTLLAAFEETFPFRETPDQDAAIEAVLGDLARDTPMDRLLVGDVGFGKTEVAMRAAFRVVESGDQVLVLCPTTVLAAQHHATFCRRFAEFPVTVALLSRFTGSAESKRVLADAAAGKVDIVIATTKALAASARFQRLGLVIVDEEHRFGTAQKEELKRRTSGVHVLSMSATPIPRTLHLALAGVREMSVMATPPEGRAPIETAVMPFDAGRVRGDILQELERGGQVFFVHNRVSSIEGVRRWLGKTVPEARVLVSHGQMRADDLERTLAAFAHREADVLLTTAIIESGIDMPTVNTMIVNRAEQFGVAQLYQLRGRVGRSDIKARCTLLVGGSGSTRKEAIARLRALQDHTALGAGFVLASQDLELRGGGEILGDKQHGHVAAIGFDAYCQLLEEAVGHLRGEDRALAEFDPEVDLPGAAYLPEDYLPDVAERLDAYQEVARCRDEGELDRVVARIEGAWGPLPTEGVLLVDVARLRARCRRLRVVRLRVLPTRAVVELHESATTGGTVLDAVVRSQPGRFRRTGERGYEARVTPEEGQFPARVASWALAALQPPGTQ